MKTSTHPIEHCEDCSDTGKTLGGDPCQDCCPHDEYDHGICLDCELDRTSDLAGAAEFHAEARAGR